MCKDYCTNRSDYMFHFIVVAVLAYMSNGILWGVS